MEFFQIVQPGTLAAASAPHVAVELALTVAFAVLLGVCVRVVPERLVPRAKTASRHDAPRKAATARAETAKTAAAPAAPAPRPQPAPASAASKTPAAPAQPAAKAAPSAARLAPVASAAAQRTLDDALDSFFQNEDLLDEALLDATTGAPVDIEGTAAPTPPPAAKPSAPSSPKRTDDFSKELAAKMTKGLQSKARPAAPGAAPPSPNQRSAPAKAATKAAPASKSTEVELDDVLDAYMAEQQLLDEAMLDSVLQSAHPQP